MSELDISLEQLTGRVTLVTDKSNFGLRRNGTNNTVWGAANMYAVAEAVAAGSTVFRGNLREAMFAQYAAFYLFNIGHLSRSLEYESVVHCQAVRLRPNVVSYISTKLCNFQCPHCYNDSGERHQSEMSVEAKSDLVAYLGRWGVRKLALSGGEPTIEPALPRILEIAAQYKMDVKLTTNAWHIPDSVFSAVENGTLSQIHISLDGADAATHDNFRRKQGSFSRVLKSLAALRTTRLPSLVLNCCIYAGSVEQMESLCRLAINAGCSGVSFKAVVFSGRKSGKSRGYILDAEQVAAFGAERNRLQGLFSSALDIDGKLITKEIPSDLLDAVSCNAGSESMMVDADGTMLPCEVISAGTNAPNLRKIAPAVAWLEGTVFEEFRDAKKTHRGGCGTLGCPGCAMKRSAGGVEKSLSPRIING